MVAVERTESEKSGIAFPENVSSSVSEQPVLDLVHLSCQTFGDQTLEKDVLGRFLDQAESTGRALRCTRDSGERSRLYHLLKGSARGVGAFQLADFAQAGEDQPDNDVHLKATLSAIAAVTDRLVSLLQPR